MSLRLALPAVAWAALLLVPRAGVRAEAIDGIAAVVGDEVILVSEVQERARPALAASEEVQSDFLRRQQQVQVLVNYLDQMVDERLISQEARRLMLQVEEPEVDRAIEGIKFQNRWTDEMLFNRIAERGQTMDEYRAETRREVLKYKVISVRLRGRIQPTDSDVERAYRQIVRLSRSSDEFEVAQLVIRIPRGATALDVQRLEDRAAELRLRVDAGEDFAALARESSEDRASAERGGSLGVVGRGELPPALDEALLMLEVGQTTGPVRGPEGFYLLKVVSGTVTGVRSLAEVRRGIEAQILEETMKRQEEVFLQNLRRTTYVDVRLR